MLRAIIYVDGEPFSGIDLDASDGPTKPGLGSGWSNPPGREMDRLLFGGEPHICVGATTLRSYMERILDRMRYGIIEAREIRIEVLEE